MWTTKDVEIDIVIAEGDEMIARVTTPAGVMELIGSVSRIGRVLILEGVHVQGLYRGALKRDGLNVIGRKFMEEADVDEIVIKGGTRTTGPNQGSAPRTIRFPKDQHCPAGGEAD